MVLILMRHPHTTANQNKTFPHHNRSPYSERGKDEFKRILQTDFKVEQVLSSPYDRARHLAEAICAKEHIPLKIIDALREVNMGAFGGKTFEEVQEAFPEESAAWLEDPEHFRYPGGDLLFERREQLIALVQTIDRDTLIISHQAILYSLSGLLGEPMAFQTGESRAYEL